MSRRSGRSEKAITSGRTDHGIESKLANEKFVDNAPSMWSKGAEKLQSIAKVVKRRGTDERFSGD